MKGIGTQIYFKIGDTIYPAACVFEISEIGGSYSADDDTGVLDDADCSTVGMYSAGDFTAGITYKNDALEHALRTAFTNKMPIDIVVGLSDNVNLTPYLVNDKLTFGHNRTGYFMSAILLSMKKTIAVDQVVTMSINCKVNGFVRGEQKEINSVPWDNNAPWDEGVLWS
jgi:hypothetical protein